jgi:excisionase family DNA binding protein
MSLPPVKAERLLGVRDVCDLLSIGRSTMYRMVASGDLRPIRIGPGKRALRFRLSDIEALTHSDDGRDVTPAA